MPGKELEPRRRSLPAELRKAVFVDWYAGRCGAHFDIYAGDPSQYSKAALEAIEGIGGLESVVLNSSTRSGELIIVVQLTAAYRRKPLKIEQVVSKIENLLNTQFRYIAYILGDGVQEFTLKEWASIRDNRA